VRPEFVRSDSTRPAIVVPEARRRLAFGVLAAVQFVLILAITVVSVALPAFSGELGLGRADRVFLSSAYGIAFSGLLLPCGRLADRLGRRRVFGAGLLIFGAGSVAAGFAPGFGILLGARFVQGVGAALAAPSALALLGAVFPDPVGRSRAHALWGGLASGGAATGIVISGVILAVASWRWIFALPVLIAFAAAAASRLIFPPDPPPRQVGLGLSSSLLVGSQVILGYGLVMAGDRGWSSTMVLVTTLTGFGLLAAFLAAERRSRMPLLPPSFFVPVSGSESGFASGSRSRARGRSGSASRLVALLAILLSAAGSATVLFFLALYFQQIHGLTPLRTSLIFLPYLAALTGTGWLAGRLVEGVGARSVTVSGLVMVAVGLYLLAGLSAAAPHWARLLAGLVVFPIGLGLAFAGSMVAALARVADGEAGLAAGVANTALEAGPALGLALLTSLAAARSDHLVAAGIALDEATTRGYGFALAVAAFVFLIAALPAALAIGTDRETGGPILGSADKQPS
jgi:MFS family permease